MNGIKILVFSLLGLLITCYSAGAMANVACGSEASLPAGTLNIGFTPASSVIQKSAGVYDVRKVPDHGVVGDLVYIASVQCISDTDGPIHYVPLVFNGACMGMFGSEFELEPTFCRAIVNHFLTDPHAVSSQPINAKSGTPFMVSARVALPLALKNHHGSGSFTLDLNSSSVKDGVRHQASKAPITAGKNIFLGGKVVSYNGPQRIKFVTVPPTCVFELNDVDFQNQTQEQVMKNSVMPLHTTLSANCNEALSGVKVKFTSPNGYMQQPGVIKSNLNDLGFLLVWADDILASKGTAVEFTKDYTLADRLFASASTTTINLPIDVTPYYNASSGSSITGQVRSSITAEINYW
ncbi:TPA: hypothetical protein NPQ76_003127 [Klebsiella quasipneumoniae subsp. quasipneumoniae]|nr:hypothetical protein [Klebsiella quasipneumoniae subsp. quasipneumoniae]